MTSTNTVTHVAFADESRWNVGRYRGIGCVTLPIGKLAETENQLRGLLSDSGMSEFAWKELRGARERFAALKLCNFAVDRASSGSFRVDVLTWDVQDRRHDVQGRDDIANLQRMYHHLLTNVLRRRWPDGSIWALHPDEHTAMDWANVQDFLEKKAIATEIEHTLFTGGRFTVRLKREFHIEQLMPVSSSAKPLVQVADLFVGLSIFSREKWTQFHGWQEHESDQQQLFASTAAEPTASKSDKERFCVLNEFNKSCKAKKLGVSLNTYQCLTTYEPQNPVNFWHYEPQHEFDKAPTRQK